MFSGHRISSCGIVDGFQMVSGWFPDGFWMPNICCIDDDRSRVSGEFLGGGWEHRISHVGLEEKFTMLPGSVDLQRRSRTHWKLLESLRIHWNPGIKNPHVW
jgi:hypothetical protein